MRKYVLVNNWTGVPYKNKKGQPVRFFTIKGADRKRRRITILGVPRAGMFDIHEMF